MPLTWQRTPADDRAACPSLLLPGLQYVQQAGVGSRCLPVSAFNS